MKIRTIAEDWKKITVLPTATFETALKTINQGGYQLCLVQNEYGKLAGMITDSDIRKSLIRGITLDQSIEKVMNPSPLIVSPSLSEIEAHQLMVINHFFHLPVVTSDGLLVGLHVAKQLQTTVTRKETLVIMAGGRGKRLMPLTESCPKPMLPLHGKPILQHLIERAHTDGFQNIVISVNYLSEKIIEFFGDGQQYNVSINYIRENKPLGTAGGLSLLDQEFQTNPVVVTNGDVITDVAYSDLLSQYYQLDADGLMAVRLQEWQNPFGVVRSEGEKIIGLEEKPIYRHQVNAGMYVVSPRLLQFIPKNNYCDMPDLFEKGLENNLKLCIFPLHESWVDIGRPSEYEAAGGIINN